MNPRQIIINNPKSKFLKAISLYAVTDGKFITEADMEGLMISLSDTSKVSMTVNGANMGEVDIPISSSSIFLTFPEKNKVAD